MTRQRFFTVALVSYFFAAVVAFFFRIQPIVNYRDAVVVRDLMDVVAIPYGLFCVVTLVLWRTTKTIRVAVLCLLVSLVVCAYTLFTYVPVFVFLQLDQKATSVFFFTPLVLLIGGAILFLLGGLGIGIHRLIYHGSAEQIVGRERRERVSHHN
jgi:hypothetical protein